jgi:2-methylisocitrate lyase-like PEP mutase family enzyme
MSIHEKATELRRLHEAPELLVLVNVWDVVSARVVAGHSATKALATASHSIAASHGYEDGENIPLDLHLAMIERIVGSTDLPVTADLEGGYGDAGETVRAAIGVGVVGANLEDELVPLPDAVKRVEAAVAAAGAEGVPFSLNARTDAWVKGGDRGEETVVADAIERGRAFLDAGATCVFIPRAGRDAIARVADALGGRKVSVIGSPGSPSVDELSTLGVARVSYGPFTQRVALTALQDAARGIYDGGGLPEDVRPLN